MEKITLCSIRTTAAWQAIGCCFGIGTAVVVGLKLYCDKVGQVDQAPYGAPGTSSSW